MGGDYINNLNKTLVTTLLILIISLIFNFYLLQSNHALKADTLKQDMKAFEDNIKRSKNISEEFSKIFESNSFGEEEQEIWSNIMVKSYEPNWNVDRIKEFVVDEEKDDIYYLKNIMRGVTIEMKNFNNDYLMKGHEKSKFILDLDKRERLKAIKLVHNEIGQINIDELEIKGINLETLAEYSRPIDNLDY